MALCEIHMENFSVFFGWKNFFVAEYKCIHWS